MREERPPNSYGEVQGKRANTRARRKPPVAGWGRETNNVNSHMHRKVVGGSIMVEVREVINWAHCGDRLSNGVDNGERHNRPVLKWVKRIQVSCARPVHFLFSHRKSSCFKTQKPSHALALCSNLSQAGNPRKGRLLDDLSLSRWESSNIG